MYVNNYADSAHFLTKAELDTWYKENIDSSISDTFGVEFPNASAVSKMTLVENGSNWFLAILSDLWRF